MPTRDAHLQFKAWAEQYGPVYSLILGTKTMIVLSSHEAVKGVYPSQWTGCSGLDVPGEVSMPTNYAH